MLWSWRDMLSNDYVKWEWNMAEWQPKDIDQSEGSGVHGDGAVECRYRCGWGHGYYKACTIHIGWTVYLACV
jgi:hypothetical protein